ncbi:unnamed protein product [Allacma fusca]|uniref:Glycoprotein-N-acetylgalactosamine 3-beta-galactosyltransferase 1 n=1 Tax=Allacma fusca TaxID=39272 RepID=A0A8J2JUQ5_9HEXA|nr:unnamed protein product [Allacma fusca]
MTSTINRVDPFLMGILFGFCLTLIIKIGSLKEPSRDFYQYENTSLAKITIVNETVDRKSSPKPLPQESTTLDTEITELKINSTIASMLEKEVRIVCWIMTRPADVTEKLAAIKTTWGKRCTKLLILSSANNNQTDPGGNNQSQGYMSGGAGYILSKESVIRFVEISVKNPDLCHQDHTGSEDFEMGKCLEKNLGMEWEAGSKQMIKKNIHLSAKGAANT